MFLGALFFAAPALAHPVPFSYLDVHVDRNMINVTLVAHVFDVAHELRVEPPELLLDPSVLGALNGAVTALFQSRLHIASGGRALEGGIWSAPEALADRQSIQVRLQYQTGNAPGVVTLNAKLFPYDPAHQTFVNFYEGATLTSQTILDANNPQLDYFVGSRQGTLAVMRKFVPAGIYHILIGPDHLLFLVGLLLLGGSLRRLLLVATAFTAALVRETGVALAPGVGFGSDGEGYIRVCFASTEATISEAMARLVKFVMTNRG